jgi:hypothetical protein
MLLIHVHIAAAMWHLAVGLSQSSQRCGVAELVKTLQELLSAWTRIRVPREASAEDATCARLAPAVRKLLSRHLPCVWLDPFSALVHLLGPAVDVKGGAASEALKEDDADGPDIKGWLHHNFRTGRVSVDSFRGCVAEGAAHSAAGF